MQKILRINHRRKKILSLISERGWVSIEDILPEIPNLKYARRVMRDLIELGLVKFTQCSMPFQAKGPGLNFYALKKQAERFCNEPIREPKIPTSTSLLHYYAINFILTGFSSLSRRHNGFGVKYIGERESRAIGYQIQNKCKDKMLEAQPAIPDFVLCFDDGISNALIIGEVDTCTETISNESAESKTIENKFASFAMAKKLGLLEILSSKFSTNFTAFTYLHITCGDEIRIKKLIKSAKKYEGIDDVLIGNFFNFLPERKCFPISYDKLIKPVFIDAFGDFENPVSIMGEI